MDPQIKNLNFPQTNPLFESSTSRSNLHFFNYCSLPPSSVCLSLFGEKDLRIAQNQALCDLTAEPRSRSVAIFGPPVLAITDPFFRLQKALIWGLLLGGCFASFNRAFPISLCSTKPPIFPHIPGRFSFRFKFPGLGSSLVWG